MRKSYSKKGNTLFFRINHQIGAPEVRLLDENANQVGIVNTLEARKKAEELELDLVEIAPKANPPVARIIDYSKWLYQQKKKKQEEKRKTQTSETKQIQLGPFIDQHDLEVKINKAKEFIKDGDKVKFVVKFRGRQITRTDLGEVVLKKVIDQLQEIAKVERDIKMEGRQMTMVMSKLK